MTASCPHKRDSDTVSQHTRVARYMAPRRHNCLAAGQRGLSARWMLTQQGRRLKKGGERREGGEEGRKGGKKQGSNQPMGTAFGRFGQQPQQQEVPTRRTKKLERGGHSNLFCQGRQTQHSPTKRSSLYSGPGWAETTSLTGS